MKNPIGRPLGKNPGLNKAEQLVADELLSGKKSVEIAAALFISHSTVKFHLTNIYHKFGVKHDRAFLANEFEKLRAELEARFLNNECISLSLHNSRMWAADQRVLQLEKERDQLKIELDQSKKDFDEYKIKSDQIIEKLKQGSTVLPLGSNPITGI